MKYFILISICFVAICCVSVKGDAYIDKSNLKFLNRFLTVNRIIYLFNFKVRSQTKILGLDWVKKFKFL